MEGKVKFFNSKDGTGFVVASDGKEYFFNRTSIKRNNNVISQPYAGDYVSFSLIEGGLVGTWVIKPLSLEILTKDPLNLNVLKNIKEIRK